VSRQARDINTVSYSSPKRQTKRLTASERHIAQAVLTSVESACIGIKRTTMAYEMSEDCARYVDAGTKILGIVVLAIGGGWTAYTYFHARADEAKKAEEAREAEAKTALRESQKPFLEKRLEYYTEAATVTATIARSKDHRKVAQAKERFWTLYSGPLALVEDPRVEKAMIEFGDCLQDKRHCSAPIEMLSLEVAHQREWSIKE